MDQFSKIVRKTRTCLCDVVSRRHFAQSLRSMLASTVDETCRLYTGDFLGLYRGIVVLVVPFLAAKLLCTCLMFSVDVV